MGKNGMYIKKINGGNLFMKIFKISFLIILLIVMVFSFTACSSSEDANENVNIDELPEFTLEELAKYDGKDGNSAYVAVEGLVYDFTDLELWKNGEHNGYEAGQDLTDAILNKSPHGVSKLKNAKIVGKLKN
jgi:predicted heme/steroid binding protein